MAQPQSFVSRKIARLVFTLGFCGVYLLCGGGKGYMIDKFGHPVLVFEWELEWKVVFGILLGAFLFFIGECVFGFVSEFIEEIRKGDSQSEKCQRSGGG
jgi:hypothetical protein